MIAACGRVRKQRIIALYFEFENELKFYNLEARLVCVFAQSDLHPYICCRLDLCSLADVNEHDLVGN